MTKKLTMKEKQKRALAQRIFDIYCGACGFIPDDPADWDCAESMSRAMNILKAMWIEERGEEQLYLFGCHNLQHFQSAKDATDFMFGNGMRAK